MLVRSHQYSILGTQNHLKGATEVVVDVLVADCLALLHIHQSVWGYPGRHLGAAVVPSPFQLVALLWYELPDLEEHSMFGISFANPDHFNIGRRPTLNFIRDALVPAISPLVPRYLTLLIQGYVRDFISEAGEAASLGTSHSLAGETGSIRVKFIDLTLYVINKITQHTC